MPAAVLMAFRLHAFGGPLETDECNYAYIGARLLAGDRLYVDVWDHQPPGVFVLFAGLIALAGGSETAIRLVALLGSLATLGLIYLVARKGMRPGSAWFAALLYAMASSDPGMAGEGANREIYMNALAVGSIACLMRPTIARITVAGVLLGLASTMKTVVAAQWAALLIALWIGQTGGGRRAISRLARMTLAFAAGPALVWIAVAGYFAVTDRFAVFYDAVFTYNLTYSQMASAPLARFAEFFVAGRPSSWAVFRTALPLWLAGGAGLVVAAVTLRRRDRAWTALVLALAIGSFVAVCLPRQFWPHYYLLMLPSLVILSAAVTDALPARPAKGYAGVLIATLLLAQGLFYLLAPADLIGVQRYKMRMLWARDQAKRLAAVTEPTDSVFVWGNADAGFYYYARRRCAARFTMIGSLLGEDPAAGRRQSLLIEDLTRNRPRVILQAMPFIPAMEQFLRENGYTEAGRDYDPANDIIRMRAYGDPSRPIRPIDWDWSEP
ncbi:MAG: glycosyltransferase family 39 protein [Phycisphaerae bacterium]|nr:glycosyltransferase family 39 protein [Phycisphaerae bacterium]